VSDASEPRYMDYDPVVLHTAEGEALFVAGQFPSAIVAVPGGTQVVILSHLAKIRVIVAETPSEVWVAFRDGLARVAPAKPVSVTNFPSPPESPSWPPEAPRVQTTIEGQALDDLDAMDRYMHPDFTYAGSPLEASVLTTLVRGGRRDADGETTPASDAAMAARAP